MISTQTKEIQALVDDIKEGRLLLPELQRQFVWKSTQVRDLFDSLYHQYPSGQLLVWETEDLPFSHAASLDGAKSDQRHPQLLLDGQQRLTSLAAIMLGLKLVVRGSKRPIDIAFNIHTEKFEVAGPRQSADAGWISLSKLFTQGVLSILTDLKLDTQSPDTKKIFDRLKAMENIKSYKYQVNLLEKLNYDEVTKIFVRINSGGTKLGSADLALAQISCRWRGVTQDISDYKSQVWKRNNRLLLDTGILIRTLSAFISGQTRLSQLFKGERQTLTVDELQENWARLMIAMDQAISFLTSNCQMDRFDLLPTQYILIPLAVFFDRFGENVTPKQILDLQRWVFMALLWMRYSASAETAADQDITAVRSDQPNQLLVQNLEDKVGKNRPFTERELRDQRKNSPFMLMAYVLARRAQAQDWFNGVVIDGDQSLEFHHIFPKDVLREKYDLKVDSRTVDQVANLAFLSKRANSKIRSLSPGQYLLDIDPSRLRAQYVPNKPEIWELDRFEEFALERRTLLADAINHLLQSLSEKPSLWVVSDLQMLDTRVNIIERQLRELIARRLFDARADEAWDLIPTELKNTIQGRIDKQVRELPFEAQGFETLEKRLEKCQFSDYLKIIRSNWFLFKDDFGDGEILSRHHQEITDVRNALKHNQEINRSKLASGEAGLLWLEECLRTSAIVEDEFEENGLENGQVEALGEVT